MFKHTLATSHLRRALIAACAVIALAPAAAQAAPGDLTYDGCLNNEGSLGCVDLPFEPQALPTDVAASQDGKSVYVTSFYSNTVLHYFRGPDGKLAYVGCVGNTGDNGCADLEGDPMINPKGVAVSPDGRSVYVVAAKTGSIVRFNRRARDGQLVFASCLSNAGEAPCGELPETPLEGAEDVTVSPDGNSVYVTAALGASTVSHFFRDEEGRISFGGCVGNRAGNGCEDLPFAPLELPRSVAVSPDGKSVYVASVGSRSVSHFFRAPQGQIVFEGCVNHNGAEPCTAAAGMAGASDVAVSPDGKSVYATAIGRGSVVHLTRLAPDGQIVPKGCISGSAIPGCEDLPGKPIDTPTDIVIARDGRTAYVASPGSQVIARLALAPTDGAPTFAGCISSNNDIGCPTQSSLPLLTLSLDVSPDQRSLYGVMPNAHTLARFSIEQPGDGGNGENGGNGSGGGQGGPGGTPADRVKPRISRLRASVRRRVPTFRFRLSEAATVRVVVQRARRAKRSVTVGRPLVRSARAGANRLAIRKRRLAAGSYRVRFVATDASGNRSAAKTARFRVK